MVAFFFQSLRVGLPESPDACGFLSAGLSTTSVIWVTKGRSAVSKTIGKGLPGRWTRRMRKQSTPAGKSVA